MLRLYLVCYAIVACRTARLYCALCVMPLDYCVLCYRDVGLIVCMLYVLGLDHVIGVRCWNLCWDVMRCACVFVRTNSMHCV